MNSAPMGVNTHRGTFCCAPWEDCVTLQGLLTLLTQRLEFRHLIQRLQEGEGVPALTGITEAARPYSIAALSAALKQPLLVIVSDEAQANQMTETLKVLAVQLNEVLYLPDRDALPYERLMNETL